MCTQSNILLIQNFNIPCRMPCAASLQSCIMIPSRVIFTIFQGHLENTQALVNFLHASETHLSETDQ